MPNIREQSITKNQIRIVSSDGREFVVTRAEIVAHYQSEVGNAAARKTATLLWLRTAVQTALGAEMVSIANLTTVDFDAADANALLQLGVT